MSEADEMRGAEMREAGCLLGIGERQPQSIGVGELDCGWVQRLIGDS